MHRLNDRSNSQGTRAAAKKDKSTNQQRRKKSHLPQKRSPADPLRRLKRGAGRTWVNRPLFYRQYLHCELVSEIACLNPQCLCDGLVVFWGSTKMGRYSRTGVKFMRSNQPLLFIEGGIPHPYNYFVIPSPHHYLFSLTDNHIHNQDKHVVRENVTRSTH